MTRLLHIEMPTEVVRGARAGRPEAQAAVYQAYSAGVYALIRRLVPRPAVADDLFQDTFVEVLQSIGRFRGEAPLGAWIRRSYQPGEQVIFGVMRDRKAVKVSVDMPEGGIGPVLQPQVRSHIGPPPAPREPPAPPKPE
jgi:hypothetical protein